MVGSKALFTLDARRGKCFGKALAINYSSE
jgi:hypothetical protein